MNSEIKRVTACIILSDILVYWFCLTTGGFLNAYLKLGHWWTHTGLYGMSPLNIALASFAILWTLLSIVGVFWIKGVIDEENQHFKKVV